MTPKLPVSLVLPIIMSLLKIDIFLKVLRIETIHEPHHRPDKRHHHAKSQVHVLHDFMHLLVYFMPDAIEPFREWRNIELIRKLDSFLNLLRVLAIVCFRLANQVLVVLRIRSAGFWLTKRFQKWFVIFLARLVWIMEVEKTGLYEKRRKCLKGLFLRAVLSFEWVECWAWKRTVLHKAVAQSGIFWHSFFFLSGSVVVFDDSLANDVLVVFWIILAASFLAVEGTLWLEKAMILFWVLRLSSSFVCIAIVIEKPSHLLKAKIKNISLSVGL